MFLNKIKKIALQKQPIFLLNGEVIRQASDSSLSKELHALTVRNDISVTRCFFVLSAVFVEDKRPKTIERLSRL